MKAVTHSMDSAAVKPVGIWWVDEDGELRSYYLPGADTESMLGSQVMSQRVCDPASYFAALDEQAPFIHDWNAVEVQGEPDKFLELLQQLRPTLVEPETKVLTPSV